jgi:hypothetical protein
MSERTRGGIVVSDRPQISIEELDGVISIHVTSIGDGFDSVDLKDVSFPIECGKEVADAILGLLKT